MCCVCTYKCKRTGLSYNFSSGYLLLPRKQLSSSTQGHVICKSYLCMRAYLNQYLHRIHSLYFFMSHILGSFLKEKSLCNNQNYTFKSKNTHAFDKSSFSFCICTLEVPRPSYTALKLNFKTC